ncbi:MAG: putative sugar O-methyltransferase [Acidobacteria bacterium]|nr:putative sugar O-methyltransferase [Acidobacteriota bacterium]
MTEDLRAAAAFQSYLRARDAVLAMTRAGAGSAEGRPSAYWAEELEYIEYIEYMIDASPLIVNKLRHHAYHITSVRPYDYRNKRDGRREHFKARLQALRAIGGDSLLVPESPALGGFGYPIDGRLLNVDTLKFYEVLIGMERGGVLDAVRGLDRPVVCEIGAGWGGFAYQFRTLFPRATYVIVDLPELFLFSATYLGVVFPDARLLFAGTSETSAVDGWRDADFVFVPNFLCRLASVLSLDLTINVASFQEMTDAQVRGYASMAATAGCPLLYSLNRERSPYNAQLTSVSLALSDSYDLTEVAVLETDHISAVKRPPKTPSRPYASAEPRYRHLVGRLAPAFRRRSVAAVPRPTASTAAGGSPRVVLGMTLYNNARRLPHALESLLAQTYSNFALLMLDDASTDDTEAIARRYVERDRRLRYIRHAERQAMIATWREVAETAAREWPSAEYFAWVSDHDWWHPRWLERLVAELDSDAGTVLAYPVTRRVLPNGQEIDKGPRLFDTAAYVDLDARWKHLCREGVGAGDMVYGLMRLDALQRAGIFRPVLRPDRLLVAELTLQGRIRQVREVLWSRRQSNGTSIERQATTLMLPDAMPRWFSWPPWLQHIFVLWREYVARNHRFLNLTRRQWVGMLLRYQVTYGWRHFRKTETSHALGRAISRLFWLKKQIKHYYHHAVYNTLVGARTARGRMRRAARRAVYEVLMLTHRLGLRGSGGSPSP